MDYNDQIAPNFLSKKKFFLVMLQVLYRHKPIIFKNPPPPTALGNPQLQKYNTSIKNQFKINVKKCDFVPATMKATSTARAKVGIPRVIR